jgi:gluconate 2-dehydrogenase gamma chain
MTISRREAIAGALSLSALPSVGAAQRGVAGPERVFFRPDEARFVEAAIERLIPSEPEWAGARDAGVLDYIDLQLAGPYGQGARVFLGGPHRPGTSEQGYQLPFTPAELYRRGLAALLESPEGGQRFIDASEADRDAFLKKLEVGEVDLGGVPSAVFFETLLTNAVEGYFADPVYGGNRDMVSWRMIGFPGSHAGYLGVYTQHGVAFDREPLSIANGRGGHGGSHGHGDAPRGNPAPLDRRR